MLKAGFSSGEERSGRTPSVGVIGAGSWGTALAISLARKGFQVTLLTRNSEKARRIREDRVNKGFLPGIIVPENVKIVCEPSNLLQCSHAIIVAVPSQSLREAIRWALKDDLSFDQFLRENQSVFPGGNGPILISATKGIEIDSSLRMSEVVLEELGDQAMGKIVALSGPNFAKEVALGMPTATVVASPCEESRHLAQDILISDSLRVYTNPDIVGVELGGALKNIYAIGVGIIDGMGLGYNARASFITRSLAEVTRFGVILGARPSTFSGLSGLGDLVLTCTGDLSRNRRCGLALGRGESLKDVLERSLEVIEGVSTTQAAYFLAMRLGVEMPVLTEMYGILFKDKDPKEVVGCLMTRLKKGEMEDIA